MLLSINLILLIILLVVFYHMITTMGLQKEDLEKIMDVEDDDNLIEGNCSSCSA